MRIAPHVLAYTTIAVLFLIFVNLAYVSLALHATPDYRYTGANQYTAADKLVYMSMVEQGREGILFMKNLHTTEPQKGLLFSPHWFLIGQTAKLFGMSNLASYQLYRVGGTVAFLILLFFLLKKLFTKTRDLVLASLFVMFSGGLGWLVFFVSPEVLRELNNAKKFFVTPTDLYVVEGNTLLNFAQSPLFIASQLLLLLIFYLYIRNRERRVGLLDAVNTGLIILVGTIHPYDLPIIATILGCWSFWHIWTTRDWRTVWRFALVLLGMAAATTFNIWVVQTEPIIAEWLRQNLVYSPPFSMYLMGYGLLMPLAAVGLYDIVRNRRDNPWWMFILIWTIAAWLLLYLPLEVNRRFLNGYHIALALTAFMGFRFLTSQVTRQWLRVAWTSSVGIVLGSNIVFFVFISLYFEPGIYTYGYYYVNAEADHVIDYLRAHTDHDDQLLISDMRTAFVITANINRTVYRGHDHQTPNSHLAQERLEWFFSDKTGPDSVASKQAFLAAQGLDYVLVNRTRLTEPVTWPSSATFLENVYETENFTVYSVVR